MAYLSDPRRADPRMLLPGCRSILVLAARYPAPEAESGRPPSRTHGRVAAYAGGQDYHLVLPERLHSLAAFLERAAGAPVAYRAYTDSGPLLERDLAQAAGLGWIGKNTCLIHPGIGSYFFLAELLLEIELEPDPPFTADRCGSCTRCLEACPTGCILPDRTLDAQRCISYLTIENRGAIPTELRPHVGEWAFGCDVCQMVCPWNTRADPLPLPDACFLPSTAEAAPFTELNCTAEEFRGRYRSSPISRARQRGYQRNLAVVMGNTAERAQIPLLEQAAASQDDLLSEHARWALERLRSRKPSRS